MASSGSGYDLSSSTFSPDGRIFQVEYASRAVESSGAALGLRCADGIVLCVEKPTNKKMMVTKNTPAGRRIYAVDGKTGLALAGYPGDGRQVANRAREEAANYLETYGSEIPPDVLASRLSAYVHYFTLHGALRPFGCTALLAGYDAATQRHSLHMIEPSGSSFEYYAAAAGRGRQPARTEMEKLAVNPTRVVAGEAGADATGTGSGGNEGGGTEGQQLISVAEGVRQLAKIVYTIRDSGGSGSSKDGPFELEMSWLCEKTGWKHVGVPKDVMEAAVEWAKSEIEAEGEEVDEEDDGEGMEE